MSPEQEDEFAAETRAAIAGLNSKVDHLSDEVARMRDEFMDETLEFMRGARTYRELQERRMLEIDAKLAENTSITEDVRDLLRGLKVFGRIAKWTGALAAAYIALREVLRLHGWWGK